MEFLFMRVAGRPWYQHGLGIYIGTVSVIIIVFAVQMVEYFFHLLHTFTHDTPFHRMVQSIEKELMVVGFTAFMFKILVDTTHFLDLDWFHALEYADILVPIFSFSYCGLGLMLILNSVRISNLWSQAYHLTLIEMLNGYYNLNGFVGYFPYGLLLAPFNPTIARMEFRIFQSIFCQTYKIQKAAFAFNEYVEKVFEKFILAMIEIRPTDWLMLCVLVLLNWARNKLHLDYRKCAIHHDLLCEEENARMMFTVAGAIIFGLTALLAIESRRLEVRIMAQKNIRSIHTYPSYLRYMEESAEAKAMDAFRLNKDELKTSAEGVKYSSTHADPEDDDDDDEEHPPVGMLSRMRSAFIPGGGGEGGGHDSHGGGRSSIRNKPNVSNKFSASVKQAWKTKKIVSKMRRRSVSQPVGQSRLAARRTSVMGLGLPGLGFGGGHHGGGGGKSWAAGGGDAGTVDSEQDDMDGSARLRQFLMSRAPPNKAKVAVIAEEDEHEENSSGSSSSSSASSDSDASEEFDVNAERHHSVEDEDAAGLQKEGVETETNKVADNSQVNTAAITIPDAPVVLSARGRPSVSTQRWKAAPLEHIEPHGFFHVFSKAQRSVDANKRTGTSVHPAYSVSASSSAHATAGGSSSSSAARYAEAYREDSKVSWGDSPVRTKQQLPPLSQRDATASSNKQSSSEDAFTSVGKTTAGDIEMGLGSAVRTKLPPISSKPESSSVSASVIPAPDAPSSAAIASATGATKVILSPSRTIGKSLPRPHHATSSPSQSHEKTMDKEKEENGKAKHNHHHHHHAHSKNTHVTSKAATPALTLAEDSSAKQTKSPMQAPSPIPSHTNKTSGNSPSAPQQGRGSNITVTNAEEEEESAPIVDVFFLSWPELYIESVQSLIMILALYYSLYFTNFIAAAGSVEWCFITLAPAVLSSLLLVYIIKCAVMLSAIHAVDCDAILEVLEQTEGARALSALMREKVMALLNEMGDDPEVELYNLFAEVDSDHSGAISRDEFAEYMNSIEIHFDRRRWMQVFRGIDTTFDNKITFEEFFVFMFPSTSHGKELQQKKERALQESLTKRSEQRLAELSHYSRSSSRFSYTPPPAPQPTGPVGSGSNNNNNHPSGVPSTAARR
eukprot:gene7663-9168_t